MNRSTVCVILTTIILLMAVGACSVDPLGELYEKGPGVYTEQVGPFLRITFNPGSDWYPSWSGDGTRIAYSAQGFEEDTQGQITVNVIPSSGGISRRVSPVWSRTDYDFYPLWMDGDNTIAYISFGGVNFSTPLEPNVTFVNPTDIEDYTEQALALNGPLDLSISPDGSALAYSDYLTTVTISGESRTSEDATYLVRRDAAANSLTALWYVQFPFTDEPKRIEGTMGATGLSWSPDSDTIAFTKSGYIYIVSHLGGEAQWKFEGRSPAWSPDGTRIACEIENNIFVYRLSDGDRTQVTTEGGVDPSWSPDSGKLAFSWNRNGNYDIYIVDLADIAGGID